MIRCEVADSFVDTGFVEMGFHFILGTDSAI
jgi:hypothetical protein